jgi:hypothetical protein
MDKVTLEALVERTHERLDDFGDPPRFSDENILRYLNQAEREAAERARLLRDSTDLDGTTPLCLIDVVAEQRSYLLNRAIFDVEWVGWEDTQSPLIKTSEDILNRHYPRWRLATSGRPPSYFIDVDISQVLRLNLSRIPTGEELQLRLIAFRLPLYEKTATDETELRAEDDEHLIDWAMYRCYMHRDPDLYDPKKAADCLADFERHFGTRESRSTVNHQLLNRTAQTVPRKV